MRRLLLFLFRVAPLAAVMGTIFFLSSQPFTQLPLPNFFGLDKILHLIAYAVLGLSVLWFHCPGAKVPPWKAALWAFGVALFFGISDEYHQSFVPNRMVSGWDVVADGLGGLLVAGVWMVRRELRDYFCWLHRYLERRLLLPNK